MDGADILDDLMVLFPTAPKAPMTEQSKPNVPLTLEEDILYKAMDTEERHIDELITLSGLTAATVSVTLMRLEMKRLVRVLPGRRYVRMV
jgi:DNA processing protein